MEETGVAGSSQLSAENTNASSSQPSDLTNDRDLLENEVGLPTNASTSEFLLPTKEEILQDTWAYLKNFFVWVEKRPDKFKTYKCILCLPKETRIKAHPSTLSHLRSHVTRQHGDHVQDFEAATRQRPRGGKRPGNSLVATAAKKGQPLIAGWAVGTGSGALQTGVNKRIVELFVSQMLSLQVKCLENGDLMLKLTNLTHIYVH
jgi:hypothetical protein